MPIREVREDHYGKLVLVLIVYFFLYANLHICDPVDPSPLFIWMYCCT
jgi:hypothetical protein